MGRPLATPNSLRWEPTSIVVETALLAAPRAEVVTLDLLDKADNDAVLAALGVKPVEALLAQRVRGWLAMLIAARDLEGGAPAGDGWVRMEELLRHTASRKALGKTAGSPAQRLEKSDRGPLSPESLGTTLMLWLHVERCELAEEGTLASKKPGAGLIQVQGAGEARRFRLLVSSEKVTGSVRDHHYYAEGCTILLERGPQPRSNEPPDAAATRGPTYTNLPGAEDNIQGRDFLIYEVRRAVEQRAPSPVIVVLRGPAGVGKTQAAILLAQHLTANATFVWWVAEAGSLTSVAATLVRLAEESGIVLLHRPEPPETTIQSVLRRASVSGRVLLVLDRAPSYARLRPALVSPTAVTLITTQDHGDWPGALTYSIDPVAPEVAGAILGTVEGPDEREAASRVARAAGYLPLVLHQIAAYRREKNTTYQQLLALLREVPEDLVEFLPPSGVTGERVSTAWDLAVVATAQALPAATALLEILSWCAPAPVPLAWIWDAHETLPAVLRDMARSVASRDAVLREATRYRLAQVAGEDISVPELVGAYLRSQQRLHSMGGVAAASQVLHFTLRRIFGPKRDFGHR